MDMTERLPAGTYVIEQDPFKNFYFRRIEDFEMPGKLYGRTTRHTDRILRTFLDRGNSTGVMLAGEKGSGKTLLAKNVAVTAAAQGIPTVVINAPWCGDAFNTLIQSIDQPMILLFDEFEKVYDKDDQERILTLLDGVFPSQKLFMLTCNDKWRVDVHMRNRPGRIFYMLDFRGLEEDFIREYCADNLQNQTYTDQICKIATMFDQFNFDMLKALIEDMNRFGESPQEVLELLNAKPEFANESNFKISLFIDDEQVPQEDVEDSEWRGNPLQKGINMGYYVRGKNKDDDDDDDGEWKHERFTAGDLQHIDSRGSRFTLVNRNGARIVLDRVKEKTPTYQWSDY